MHQLAFVSCSFMMDQKGMSNDVILSILCMHSVSTRALGAVTLIRDYSHHAPVVHPLAFFYRIYTRLPAPHPLPLPWGLPLRAFCAGDKTFCHAGQTSPGQRWGPGRQGNALTNSAAKPLRQPSNQESGLVLRMHNGGRAHPPNQTRHSRLTGKLLLSSSPPGIKGH